MADNISNVVAWGNVDPDIDKLIKRLMSVEETINQINRNAITIKVDLQGAESINTLTNAINKQQEAIDKLTILQKDNKDATAQLQAVNNAYGQSVAANADKLAQQKLELGYVTEQLKILNKDIVEGKGNVDKNNESLATWTRRQQELKVEIGSTTSAIKSQVKENFAAKGSMDELSQSLFQLKERYRALSQSERENVQVGGALQKQIQTLDVQVKELDKAIGNSQRNVGNYGSAFGKTGEKIAQFIERDLLRGVAGFLIFNLAFEAGAKLVDMFTTSIMENIKWTEQWIEKQARAIQSGKDIQKAFADVGDALNKLSEQQRKLNESTDESAEGLRRKANLLKAIGVINREIYDYEKKTLDADDIVRQKELAQLNEKLAIYDKLNKVIANTSTVSNPTTGQLDASILVKAVKNSGLPKEVQEQFNVDLFKGTKDLSADEKQIAVFKNLKFITKQYGETVKDTQQEIENKKNESEVAQAAFAAKVRGIHDAKTIELTKQLATTQEQFRLANQKEDIASIDKIVNDTRAKYMLLANDIKRSRDEYIKQVGGSDANVATYNKLLSLLKQIGEQERKNSQFELTQQQYAGSLSTGAALSSGNADILKNSAAFGLPDYDLLKGAIDAQGEAKKTALKAQFIQQAQTITESTQVIEAQRQLDERLKQVDKDSYKDRLDLVNDYFSKVSEQINKTAAPLLLKSETGLLNQLTGIISGKGTIAGKENRSFVATQLAAIRKGRQEAAIAGEKLPVAQSAYNSATNAVDAAPDQKKKEEAIKTQTAALINLRSVENDLAQANNDVANAEFALNKKKKEAYRDLAATAIEEAKKAADAILQIQENRLAKEQMQLDIKERKLRISTEQEIQKIQATTNFQITKDNQIARITAAAQAQQNQIEKEKQQIEIKQAKFEKAAAIANAIASVAQAEAQALIYLSNPVTAPFYPAVAAIIASVGAAQIAAASSVPIPQYKYGTPDGGTHTPMFIAGDGGEKELIAPPNKPAYWSSNKSTLYNEPLGTHVIPMNKLIQYATANITALPQFGLHQAESQANNDIMIKTMTAVLGDKLDDGFGAVVESVFRSRVHIPKDTSIADAIRENKNLKLR